MLGDDDFGASILDAYKRASSFKPITRRQIQTAYRPYGIPKNFVQGKSDSALRYKAVSEVLNWYGNQQTRRPRVTAGARTRRTSTTTRRPTARRRVTVRRPMLRSGR